MLTFDSDSGFEWLDLSVTRGLSVLDVLAGGGGLLDLGFRYATEAEVTSLYRNAGISEFSAPRVSLAGPVLSLIGLLSPSSVTLADNSVLVGTAANQPISSLLAQQPAPIQIVSLGLYQPDLNSGLAQIGFLKWEANLAMQPFVPDGSANLGVSDTQLTTRSIGSHLLRPTAISEPTTAALFAVGILIVSVLCWLWGRAPE